MELDENTWIKDRIEKIRPFGKEKREWIELFEAVSLAQSVVHDTVGGNHPIMAALDAALKSGDWMEAMAACSSVVTLYDGGSLRSPRLAIAHEIEGDILNIAEEQVKAAEKNTEATQKQLQLAIAAFLTGAALEDALRRLCDARTIKYDPQRTSISTLQAALYQPSKQIEVISKSENDYITAWGKTRNNADHGRFDDITHTEVLTMVIGVRGFIDRHLP